MSLSLCHRRLYIVGISVALTDVMKIDTSAFLTHLWVQSKTLHEMHDCTSHKEDKQLPGITAIRMMLSGIKGRAIRRYQNFNSCKFYGEHFSLLVEKGVGVSIHSLLCFTRYSQHHKNLGHEQ